MKRGKTARNYPGTIHSAFLHRWDALKKGVISYRSTFQLAHPLRCPTLYIHTDLTIAAQVSNTSDSTTKALDHNIF